MKKKITPQKAVIALFCTAVFGFTLFAIYSQILSLQTVKAQIKAEQNLIVKARKNLQVLNTLREHETFMVNQIKILNNAIPPVVDELSTILHIESALGFPESEIIDIRFESKISKDGYDELPVKVIYEGYYHGLTAFLNNLQHGSRIIRIDSVRISRGSAGFPHIKADINISTFYRNN